MTRRVLTAALVLAVLAPAAASADGLDVTKFRPSPHAHDVFTTKFNDIPAGLRFGGGVLLHFSQNDFVWERETATGTDLDKVVKDRLVLDLMGSVTFLDHVSVGVLLPVALLNKRGPVGFTGIPTDEGASVGDLGLSAKAALVRRGGGDGVGFGLALDLKLPTGNAEAWMSDDGVSIMPQILVDGSFAGYKLGFNIGYLIRPNFAGQGFSNFFTVGDELDFRAAAEAPIAADFSAIGQFAASTVLSDFFGDRNTNYFEFDVGVRYRHTSGIVGQLGGGSSVGKGYGNVKFRLIAGLAYEPQLESPDTDGDGIPDNEDACPTDPEDFDGFEDTDGCPDVDNDGDGILDVNDQCPDDKEDRDGFEDTDGCPDPDNDNDGIADINDLCPMDAEDFDGFEDGDGCPDLDNDKDGIPDARDACPDQAEVINDYQDDDGCPDTPPRVEVTKDRIIIREKVFFEFDKAKIKPESFSILDAVAEIMASHPELKKVRIEGHTDFIGRHGYNMRLSRRRAGAVMKYLIKKGVSPSRLTFQGFGPDRPIADNTTPEGRSINRRVEFHIVDRTDGITDPDAFPGD